MVIFEKILYFLKSVFGKKNMEVSFIEKENEENEVKKEINIHENNVKEKSEIIMTEEVLNGAQYEEVGKKMYSNLIVVLDPGHALATAGKKSPYSLKKVSSPELPFEEWQFNREITYRLIPMLHEYGIETFVTTDTERDGNFDLQLSKRAERANEYVKKSGKRGLYISIHSDADGMGDKWTGAHGWSCFTTEGQNNSDKFADCLYDAAEQIFKQFGLTIRTDKKDGDRDWESNFTVLFKSNMPAVLTENFFYTNIDDLKFISSEEGKNAVATVHLFGILKFADTIYKM